MTDHTIFGVPTETAVTVGFTVVTIVGGFIYRKIHLVEQNQTKIEDIEKRMDMTDKHVQIEVEKCEKRTDKHETEIGKIYTKLEGIETKLDFIRDNIYNRGKRQ